jgi:hypothetical protein
LDGVGLLVCLLWASEGPQKESTQRRSHCHQQKTEDGTTRQGCFPWQEARVEQNAHLPSAERCSRLSSNQRQSHPQETVRLEKDAFLGRRPLLNRRYISHQLLKDAKTLVEPGLQSSNQRQSSPQKTVRLDKDAFLGRQPMLNRTTSRVSVWRTPQNPSSIQCCQLEPSTVACGNS